jgi:hypothetical protein
MGVEVLEGNLGDRESGVWSPESGLESGSFWKLLEGTRLVEPRGQRKASGRLGTGEFFFCLGNGDLVDE